MVNDNDQTIMVRQSGISWESIRNCLVISRVITNVHALSMTLSAVSDACDGFALSKIIMMIKPRRDIYQQEAKSISNYNDDQTGFLVEKVV